MEWSFSLLGTLLDLASAQRLPPSFMTLDAWLGLVIFIFHTFSIFFASQHLMSLTLLSVLECCQVFVLFICFTIAYLYFCMIIPEKISTWLGLKPFIGTSHPNIFPHDILVYWTSVYIVLVHTENRHIRNNSCFPSYSHNATLQEQLLFL